MRMKKMNLEKFRIGQLADMLEVKRFVIRFWEKEFAIKADRSHGGQRFYTIKDVEKFKLIKTLLYERGFTIAGAKKMLKTHKPTDHIVASRKTTITPKKTTTSPVKPPVIRQENDKLSEKIMTLQKQLHKLRELLS